MFGEVPTLRGALRVFRVRPRFALLASGTYALGIGAVVAVFGLVDEVVLDPLPWPAADRVVGVWESNLELGAPRVPAAPAKIAAWREADDVFSAVAAWRLDAYDLTGAEGAERIEVGRVDPRIFEVLGVRPALGRLFDPGEAESGSERVALLGHGFWVTRHGADPGVMGSDVILDGTPYEVVGVLPPGMHFPEEARILVPLVIDEPASRSAHAYRVLAQRAPGVTVEDARARMHALAEGLERAHPETDRGWGIAVLDLREQLVGDVTPVLLLFLGAGALVFLVACVDGGALLLVRATERRRELAVRTSLGASRSRLVLELAAESVLLALTGGVAGIALAGLALSLLGGLAPAGVPVTPAVGLDGTVLLFALGASLSAGLLFGLLPALPRTEGNPMAALREAGSTTPPARRRVWGAAVGAQIALAALLLVGSGLFLRSAHAVGGVDPGFRSDGLLAVDLTPSPERYTSSAERLELYRRLLERSAALPGVRSAAFVNSLPLGGRTDLFRFQVEGRRVESVADLDVAAFRTVSAGYFEAMDVPLVRGRSLDAVREAGDAAGEVAVVNEAMARRFWPGDDPVGSRISFDGEEGPWIRIVGVVADVRHDGLLADARPEVFVPLEQDPWRYATLVLGTGSDPAALAGPVRDVVREIDPLLPLTSVRTVDSLVDAERAPWRFQALLVAIFAAVAAGLALLGVYGLLAFVVHARGRELAVRRALGARGRDLGRLVAGGALGLALAGTGTGLVAAGLLSGTVESLLYGVPAVDPSTYALTALLLFGAAGLAAWIPVRRAARADPARALRAS